MRERAREMLERGIGVSGERLERGGVVGGLPGIGLAGKHLAEQLSRLLLAPDVRFRARDLEILPRLRLECFARLCTDREHESLRFDGDCLSHCVRLYVHERCRAGVERFVLDGEADPPAHDDVNLLVTVRLAMAFDHWRSDRSSPAVDTERAH